LIERRRVKNHFKDGITSATSTSLNMNQKSEEIYV
jgi:hypothetical protein